MRQNQTQPNHPIEDSPYHLHLFRKNEFLSLEGCCSKGSFLYPTNLYIITYNPFEEKETEFDIYSCSQCGAMYIEAEGKYRKMENLLNYEVKLR